MTEDDRSGVDRPTNPPRTNGIHHTTFAAGVLVVAAGLGLLAEGVGWWDLNRSNLPYVAPLLLILIGATGIAHGLVRADEAERATPGP